MVCCLSSMVETQLRIRYTEHNPRASTEQRPILPSIAHGGLIGGCVRVTDTKAGRMGGSYGTILALLRYSSGYWSLGDRLLGRGFGEVSGPLKSFPDRITKQGRSYYRRILTKSEARAYVRGIQAGDDRH